MPQDYTATNPQTGETVRWDGKAWTPVPSSGPLKRFGTSLAGVPENVDLKDTSGIASLGAWFDSLKQAASSLNPIPGVRSAAETGMGNMGQPGAMNKITGATEYALSGVPYAGPATVDAMEKFKKGDYAGGTGASIGAGMMGTGVAEAAPKLAEMRPLRAITRGAAGLGKTGERVAGEKANIEASDTMQENKDALSKASDEKLDQSGSVMSRNAKKIEAYRDDTLEAQENNKREMQRIQAHHEQQVASDADARAQQESRQRDAAQSKKHADDLANGLLQEVASKARNEASSRYVPLEDDSSSPSYIKGTIPGGDIHKFILKTANDLGIEPHRVGGIAKKILDDTSPVSGAIVKKLTESETSATYAAKNFLRSGMSVDDTRGAMANQFPEFSGDQIDRIVSATQGNVVEPGQSGGFTFKELRRMYNLLGDTIPEMQGTDQKLASELKKYIGGGFDRDAGSRVGGKLRELAAADDSTGAKLSLYDAAQSGYNKYYNTFKNYASNKLGGHPIARALRSYDRITSKLRPPSVWDELKDSENYDLARRDMEMFNHLGFRMDVLENLKNTWDSSQKPINVKTVPPLGDIKLKPMPPPPELEPLPPPGWKKPVEQKPVSGFDPSQWRIDELKRRGEQSLGPAAAPGSKYRIFSTIANRVIAELYNNPEFRKWMAGTRTNAGMK